MKIGLLGMGTVGGGVRELAERLPDVKIARILERVHTRPEMTKPYRGYSAGRQHFADC